MKPYRTNDRNSIDEMNAWDLYRNKVKIDEGSSGSPREYCGVSEWVTPMLSVRCALQPRKVRLWL